MSVQSRANPASLWGRETAKPFPMWVAVVATLALTLSGCVGVPPAPLAGPDPADPSAQTPPVRYQSTTGGYVRQRPVEPAPWREQNDRVAPQPKP